MDDVLHGLRLRGVVLLRDARAAALQNTVHEGTRNRAENVIRKVKGHKLFSGRTFHDNGSYVGPWIKALEAARDES